MEDLLDGQTEAPEGVEDLPVDVIEFKRTSDIRLAATKDPDSTEYSSSFADTTSRNENCSELSDAEAESQFYDENSLASAFDGFSSVFPLRSQQNYRPVCLDQILM
ncbi:unnamed protein product [Ilex paraguariensis]|uniref:Uncharacterized protein n=1 Tax=Ilex paraguariensis TaxID=185542 RepID=A0ABC8UQW3_9AQUA